MGVGPASIMVGNLVAGKRIAQATGRELGVVEDEGLVRKVSPARLHPGLLSGGSLPSQTPPRPAVWREPAQQHAAHTTGATGRWVDGWRKR